MRMQEGGDEALLLASTWRPSRPSTQPTVWLRWLFWRLVLDSFGVALLPSESVAALGLAADADRRLAKVGILKIMNVA